MKDTSSKGIQLYGVTSNPYHLSVGGVVVVKGEVALIRKKDNIHTLPRETAFSGESITEAVIRGFNEEVGIVVEIEKYIGSLIVYFALPNGTKVEKTTLYFLCNKISESNRKLEDFEIEDKVVWMPLAKAVDLLKNEQKEEGNSEYKILERVLSAKGR